MPLRAEPDHSTDLTALAEQLDGMSPAQLTRFLHGCTPEELAHVEAAMALGDGWHPQDYQRLPDGPWNLFLFLAGRYVGKTDTGAHAFNEHATGPPCDPRVPGGHRMRLIGPTFTDTVASCVNGPTGLKAHNPDVKLKDTKEGTIVEWPNGAVARIFGAFTPEDPERLRAGGNSCFDWYEELATWRQLDASYEQAEFGLRLGTNSRAIGTTTPKNRAKIRELKKVGEAYANATPAERAKMTRARRVYIRSATTADNAYGDPEVRASLYATYAGTRLGAQELEAQVLEDLGTFFSRSWFGYRDVATRLPRKVRSWDLAGTPPGPANEDPDWTVGGLVAYDPMPVPHTLQDGTVIRAGRFVIEDVVRLRGSPAEVEQTVIDTARRDGPSVEVVIEREPGQSGKSQVAHFKQALQGIALVQEFSPSGPKAVRAQLVSGAAQQGRVDIVRGAWNVAMLDEMEEFTGTALDAHDDQVDMLSQAFAVLEGRGGVVSIAPTSERRVEKPKPGARATIGQGARQVGRPRTRGSSALFPR